MESNASAKVQHVNKKSSDKLLRKFACDDPDTEEDDNIEASPNKLKSLQLAVSKRKKISKRAREIHDEQYCESPLSNNGKNTKIVAEKKSLLQAPSNSRKSVLLRQMGIHNRAHLRLRVRDFRNKSLLGTIEKVTLFLFLSFIIFFNPLKVLN